jgi:hypothetical protein
MPTILNKKINMLNNIRKGDIIVNVNNIDVYDIKSLRNAIKTPIIINRKKYIKIENNKGKSIIMSVKELLVEDEIFSQNYQYEISDLFDKIKVIK